MAAFGLNKKEQYAYNKRWWCFSKPEITLLADKTKTRPVIGKWSDKDVFILLKTTYRLTKMKQKQNVISLTK